MTIGHAFRFTGSPGDSWCPCGILSQTPQFERTTQTSQPTRTVVCSRSDGKLPHGSEDRGWTHLPAIGSEESRTARRSRRPLGPRQPPAGADGI